MLLSFLNNNNNKKRNGIELWQWYYRNRREKKIVLVCGNAIAEIGGKKFVAIVAMPLPQFHSTFFFFFLRNDMCTQFLQYFYNKF